MKKRDSARPRHPKWLLRLQQLLVVAIVLFFPVKVGGEQVWRLLTYQEIEGRVTEVAVIMETRSRGRTVYKPVVTYQYDVGARRYVGSRLRPGPYGSRIREDAEKDIAAYAPDDHVTVYVNRGDSQVSFLERKVSWWPYWSIPLLLFFFSPFYSWIFERKRNPGTGDGSVQ